MAGSMMQRFADSEFEPIDYEGQTVYPRVSFEVAVGDEFLVEWVSAGSPRPQGLSLRLRDPRVPGAKGRAGEIEIAGRASPVMAVWMDTAPRLVRARVTKVKSGGRLFISNRWRTEDGVEHEWLNNYGILIERDAPWLILRCSDGVGLAPTFDDLVVRLRHVPAEEIERA